MGKQTAAQAKEVYYLLLVNQAGTGASRYIRYVNQMALENSRNRIHGLNSFLFHE